jgi:hypothetical protein
VRRRELALELVFEGEVERLLRAGLPVVKRSLRFPRIVVTVVAEEDEISPRETAAEKTHTVAARNR